MITKAEVRAVALGKLALPGDGVLWDVGAGSGSVAIEAARLAPGLDVYAVDRDVTQLNANASAPKLRVVDGDAPAALNALPDPDRAFLGGAAGEGGADTGGGAGDQDDLTGEAAAHATRTSNLPTLMPSNSMLSASGALSR